MTRHKTNKTRPNGHVMIPAAAIGGLAIILVAGLDALGFLDRTNVMVARLLSGNGFDAFPKHLPDWTLWLATAVFAFGLAFTMLATPGHWRRCILWITSVALVTAWAPVLGLAAHAPEISGPWLGALWSGVCALVYTSNHRMACDEPSATPDEPR